MHFLSHFPGVAQEASISPTNPSVIAGKNVSIFCYHTVGYLVTLVTTATSQISTNFVNGSQSNFVLMSVSSADDKKQFQCQISGAISAAATLSVWCELIKIA